MLAHTTCKMQLRSSWRSDVYIHRSTSTHSLSIYLKHTHTHSPLLPTRPSFYFSSSINAMRGPNTKAFQQGFLKNMILSLQACSEFCISSSASGCAAMMSLQQRKCAIKSSADIAMATARGGGARWPQAVLASSSSPSRRPSKPSSSPGKKKNTRVCKKIVRRCLHTRRRSRGGTGAASSLARTRTAMIGSREIARRLVRKRTKVLRKMIPGGELLDEISLLHEAVDYVAHLHAQVDVLRRISNAVQRG